MAALEWLCHLTGVNSKKFTKYEIWILEAELYIRIHQEIWKTCKSRYKDYIYLIQANFGKEEIIMELFVIRNLINDLLKSEEYTLCGIAYYTQVPEEIIEDLLMGNKVSSVITFTRKLIELHKLTRPDFYKSLIKKLITEKQNEEKQDEKSEK